MKTLFLSMFLAICVLLASCGSPGSSVKSVASSPEESPIDSVELPTDADYALLYLYRKGGMGAAVGYNLYLGDSLICRVKSNWKTPIKIYKYGADTIWAKTESKVKCPITLEKGRSYYVRCGMKMGIVVGRPTINIVDSKTGKQEYAAIKKETISTTDVAAKTDK